MLDFDAPPWLLRGSDCFFFGVSGFFWNRCAVLSPNAFLRGAIFFLHVAVVFSGFPHPWALPLPWELLLRPQLFCSDHRSIE